MSAHFNVAGVDASGNPLNTEAGYPQNALVAWQPSTLGYVKVTVDAAGALITAGGAGGGGAVTVADGADVVEGALADAAITTDAAGTVSGKLRGLIKILADVWDSAAGRLKVDSSSNAVVNAGNSTTTPLGANANFTGTTIDLLGYSTLRVSLYSDQSSATNGFKVEFSNEGTNWDLIRQTTYTNGNGETVVFNRVARYARVNYTNSGGAQAVFRLQTLLVPNSAEFVRHFLSDIPKGSDTAIMTQSVLVGQTTAGGGAFVNVKVNPSGALTAEVTQDGVWSIGLDAATLAALETVNVLGPLTDTQLRATAVPVSIAAAVALDAGTLAALETIELGAGTLAALETISVANFPATQPVSGTVELGSTSLAALETITVTGPLTDTQLRATAVPVSQPAATDWRADLRRGLTPLFAVISASTSGDNQIVAAQAGLKIKVLQYTLVADAAVAVTWRSATTPLTGSMSFAANGGTSSPYVPAGAGHLFETAVNTALNLNLGAAVGVRGHLTYILEA